MRALLACGLFILLLGCVDYQLSGNEKLACASFTSVTVTGIPFCEKNTSCQEEFDSVLGTPSFHWLPIGSEWEKTKNQLIGSWISLNETHEWMKKTNDYCKKGNVFDIWSAGIDSAGSIQKGLKAAEQTNTITLTALAKSLEKAEKWELVRVKDTSAFQAYAELLETVQSITTNDSSDTTASLFSQNQAYFQGLAEKITQNQTSGTTVDWKSAFDVYKTGVKIGTGTNAKTILAFSPVWQGMISAFSNQSKAVQSLSVLQYVNAPQMVEKISQIVRPQNGFAGKVMQTLVKLEEGMNTLENEEIENNETIQVKVTELSIQIENAKEELAKWKEIENKVISWASVTNTSVPHGAVNFQKWNNELEKNKSEWEFLREGKINGTISIGKRIESQRAIEKALTSIANGINQEEILLENKKITCIQIVNHLNETMKESISEEGEFTCKGMLEALEDSSFESIEEYENASVELCVIELNKWNSGLGIEPTHAESFIYEFGSAALSACESAVLFAQTEYENQFTIQEINQIATQIKEWLNAVDLLPAGTGGNWTSGIESDIPLIEDLLTSLDEPVLPDHQNEVLEQLDEYASLLENSMSEAWKEYALTKKWKVTSDEIIHTNSPVEGTWELTIDNPLHVSWEHPFALEWKTNVEWNAIETTSGTVHVEEGIVNVQGEEIPAEGVKIQGVGSGIVVEESNTIQSIETMGYAASISEVVQLTTEYYPTGVEWDWTAPTGVDIENVHAVEGGSWISLLWEGKQAKAILELNQANHTIVVDYWREGVIETQTSLVETSEEVGKTVYVYQISVVNHTALDLTIEISTGISADPFETSSVLIMSEGGAVTAYETNALFGVVISNVFIQGNGTQTYYATIVRPEGGDTLKSLFQTLLSEIEPLLTHSNSIVAAKAHVIQQKIENVLETNNPEKMAIALPGLTNEVQALLLEAHQLDEEWAEINAEWNELLEIIHTNEEWEQDEQIVQWIQNGNAAQEFGQVDQIQKMSEKIQKWIADQKRDSVPTEADQKNGDLGEEITTAIELGKKVSADILTYEKKLSLTCAKLLEVGYVCPISEEQVNKIKKYARDETKNIEKTKNIVQKGQMSKEEIEANEKKIIALITELEKYETQIKMGLETLEKSAEKMINELQEKTVNEKQNELSDAREKAENAFEKKEYGKAIYIAQNILNYLKGKNPLVGLTSIPPEGIPLIAIAIAGISFFGYRRWKEKNKPEIIPQTVPQKITNPREQLDNDE